MGDMHDHHIPELPDERDLPYGGPAMMAIRRSDARIALAWRERVDRAKRRWFWTGLTIGVALGSLGYWRVAAFLDR